MKGDRQEAEPAFAPEQYALSITAESAEDLDAILNIVSRMSGVRATVANPEAT